MQNYLETPENIETNIKAWEKFASLCVKTQDWLGEIHARVEIAQLPGTQFFVISDTANRLNSFFRQQLLVLDTDEKEILVNKLLEVMEKRIQEGDATDCSRIAWLFLHIRNEQKAKEYTEMGLTKDGMNEYILSLSEKLKIY